MVDKIIPGQNNQLFANLSEVNFAENNYVVDNGKVFKPVDRSTWFVSKNDRIEGLKMLAKIIKGSYGYLRDLDGKVLNGRIISRYNISQNLEELIAEVGSLDDIVASNLSYASAGIAPSVQYTSKKDIPFEQVKHGRLYSALQKGELLDFARVDADLNLKEKSGGSPHPKENLLMVRRLRTAVVAHIEEIHENYDAKKIGQNLEKLRKKLIRQVEIDSDKLPKGERIAHVKEINEAFQEMTVLLARGPKKEEPKKSSSLESAAKSAVQFVKAIAPSALVFGGAMAARAYFA